jgi:hypothetical protein
LASTRAGVRAIAFASLLLGLPLARGVRPATAEPDAAATAAVVHRLPFPAGASYSVFQGNDQPPTHHDEWNRYAFDFTMAPGTPVCASADGVVTYVKEDSTGPTGNVSDNNEVAVLHADGRVGTYLHLERDGALVEVDQRVFAGDVIGRSGNTGASSGPHLHFGLKEGTRLGRSVPCRFEDCGGGVPQKGDVVVSQNASARLLRDAFDRLERLYDLAAKGDFRASIVDSLAPLLKPKPSAELATVIAALGGGQDVRAVYEERRAALVARYRADAEAALASIAAARASGDLRAAGALATLGKADYQPLDVAARFQAALVELGKDPAYAKAAPSLGAAQTWRAELARALASERDARERSAKGKKVDWAPIGRVFEALVKRAPTDAARDALATYLSEAPPRAAPGK